ncbi:tetratricopeptide repeat-containing sulfotransferase family protein [Arenimonas fontis]|nr:tetratricopeptide repeat-containing sulfotransferase family protein [Arenimonas fontis]
MTRTDAPSRPVQAIDELEASKLRRLMRRAESYRSAGQDEAAADALQRALGVRPDHVPALLMLARLHLDHERHGPARAAIMRALGGHLESPRVALDLIHMLNQLSESGLMAEVAKQLPPPLWDSATSLTELAQELALAGVLAPARVFARAALERDPNHPPALAMNATLDVFHGDLAAAAEHGERCLRFVPDDPGTHWLLSRLRLPEPQRRIPRIEKALARNPRPEDQAYLGYALHNELHELGDYDRAWHALESACRAKLATLHYRRNDADALFDALLGWQPEELIREDGCDDPGLIPVFVIGLHRSGTTLAERILTGHSRVAAGGETYDIRAALRRASGLHFSSELDLRVVQARHALDYRAIGESYLRGMAWRTGGKPIVSDKLPSNYYNVGFIARAMPRARFIHLNRDPLDVGLSSLRTLFSHACPYSYDQLDYVAHWRNYRRLMEHWRRLLPDRILDVDYDALVNDPSGQAARMAAFCGLEFEPAMVDIDRRDDAVSTASSVMMREGIRRDRGHLWERYRQHLQPMISALAGGGQAGI